MAFRRELLVACSLAKTVLIWIALVMVTQTPTYAESKKKLIYFGIDKPRVLELPQKVRQLEEAPFDGWVFTVGSNVRGDDGKKLYLTHHSWSTRKFTKQELQPSLKAFQATKFQKFTDNFIRYNNQPADVDWFDDFDAIVHNSALAAWLCREGGLKGIFYDNEIYDDKFWDYHKQRDADTKSFEEYAAQVRLRGRQIMKAMQREYPDLTLILAVSYTFNYQRALRPVYGGPAFPVNSNDPKKLHYFMYGLLPAFLDGMLDVAGPDVTIVDGCEFTYYKTRRREFRAARRMFTTHVSPFVADMDRYREKFRLGFGIFFDALWYKDQDERGFYDANPGLTEYAGWSASDFTKNYRQPEEMKITLANALKESDKYVWLYSERVFFQGDHKNVPGPYEQAIIDARRTSMGASKGRGSP